MYFHDPDYFLINSNPVAFPSIRKKIYPNASVSHYYNLEVVEHQKLDLPGHTCHPSRSYSYLGCIRAALTLRTGCRLPWHLTTGGPHPPCTEVDQFTEYEAVYTKFNYLETANIEAMTGCRRPCWYRQYRC